jgi:hypothetical protein
VPVTVATQVAVCAVVMEEGVATTVMLVTVGGGALIVMGAEPETLVYPAWAELAMQLPDPEPEGVNTPPEVIVPPVAVQVTAEL